MSVSRPELVVVDASPQGPATCVVCGKEIAPGSGVTARFDGQILRFKCPGCLSRFAADPARYLSGGPAACCEGEDHES